jgi:hypothetical protein
MATSAFVLDLDYDALETRAIAKLAADCMAAVVNGARTVEDVARAIHEGEIITRFILQFLVDGEKLIREGSIYRVA